MLRPDIDWPNLESKTFHCSKDPEIEPGHNLQLRVNSLIGLLHFYFAVSIGVELMNGSTLGRNSCRQEIKTATSSMTSVPKPLKFLRPHYRTLKTHYEKMHESELKVCPLVVAIVREGFIWNCSQFSSCCLWIGFSMLVSWWWWNLILFDLLFLVADVSCWHHISASPHHVRRRRQSKSFSYCLTWPALSLYGAVSVSCFSGVNHGTVIGYFKGCDTSYYFLFSHQSYITQPSQHWLLLPPSWVCS